MKPHYSLAEAFQRGQFKVEYPRSEQTVSYYCRIYPELDIAELLKTDAVEGLQSPGPKGIMGFDYRDSRVAATTYGWTASLDYCNEDSEEIVHRTAAILSIVETCRRLNIPVRGYLGSVLPGLANFPINQIAELTPTAWRLESSRPLNLLGAAPPLRVEHTGRSVNCRRSVENRPVVVDSKPATKLVSYRAGVVLAKRMLGLHKGSCDKTQ
jgi:hypothetical protein